jgi:gamma-glutamyltranspeptidase/glutathione hydrolase
MCPLAISKGGKPWVALGACGGRRIIPAVAQLTAFLVDCGMSLEEAFATPRIEASAETLLLDHRLPRETLAALEQRFPVEVVEDQVYPSRFAIPSAVMRDGGRNSGMTHIHSPAASAVAEPG